MKQLMVNLFFIFVVLPCDGAIKITANSRSDDGLGHLRNEIKKLENELEIKTNNLNKCAEKNKNFQIAGVTTVGLAVAGTATNISLHSKIKDQEKTAINMNNKIQNNNAQTDAFLTDVENLSKNIDYDKFVMELDATLTDAEKQRFKELFHDGFKIDDNDSNVPESDKVLLKKIIRAMHNSQKL